MHFLSLLCQRNRNALVAGGGDSAPYPAGELIVLLPMPLAGFEEATLWRGREGKGRERNGKEGRERGKEGRESEGKMEGSVGEGKIRDGNLAHCSSTNLRALVK